MSETTQIQQADTPQTLLSSINGCDPKEKSSHHSSIMVPFGPTTMPPPSPCPDISAFQNSPSPRSIDGGYVSDHPETHEFPGDAILIGFMGDWSNPEIPRVAGSEGLPDDVALESAALRRQESAGGDLNNEMWLPNLASGAREAARLGNLPLAPVESTPGLTSDTFVVTNHLFVHDTPLTTDASTQHHQMPS
ncbi:hypothetical protein FSARC_8453 [Fusarium sarcochroum]|uniref:Uncharacterized protein n=1 Tax=Fusarium sarcochroum TaxID=1208366 RepID=A0A8H4TT79_9HYPO|nr:hypothetical protein FSARC_8453 [Fusarium sarcochroum]